MRKIRIASVWPRCYSRFELQQIFLHTDEGQAYSMTTWNLEMLHRQRTADTLPPFWRLPKVHNTAGIILSINSRFISVLAGYHAVGKATKRQTK